MYSEFKYTRNSESYDFHLARRLYDNEAFDIVLHIHVILCCCRKNGSIN